MTDYPTVLDEVAAERRRQTAVEGWSQAHDDQHTDRSLALAAALYAAPIKLQEVRAHDDGTVVTRDPWPWHSVDYDPQSRAGVSNAWDKRSKHSERRRLVIAAALIVAEIERLDRAQGASTDPGTK